MKTRLCFALMITFFLFMPVLSAHADPLGERIAFEVCILGDGRNPIQISEEEAARWKASAIYASIFRTVFDGHAYRDFDGDFTKETGSNVGQCVRSFINTLGTLVCIGSDVELVEGTTTIRQYNVKRILCR